MLRREDGYTLIEMLLSVTLSAIVLGAVVSFVLTGYRGAQVTTDAFDNSQELSLIRIHLLDDGRSAYPDPALTAVSADGRRLTLAIYDQTLGFRTVVYEYLPAGAMTRQITRGSGTPETARTIADRLVPSYVSPASGAPIFQVSGSVITATIPIQGRPTSNEIKALIRPQAP